MVVIPYAKQEYNLSDSKGPGMRMNDVGPREFVSLVKNAELVFTDSFHGAVFSLIHQVPFVVFERNKSGHVSMNSRLYDLLELFQEKHNNVHVDTGINLGFRQSFIQALLSVMGYEYYSFSDQDDYWEKEKLYQACLKLQEVKTGKPAVYYSNLNVADANLNVYRTTKLQNRKKSLESLVMRRSIAGCTMVFNECLWDKIAEVDITDDMLKRGHDSFILSLCYALGGTVAKALNQLTAAAQKGGFEWILTLDQDSVAPSNISEEFEKYTNNLNTGMLCPVICDRNKGVVVEAKDGYKSSVFLKFS